MPAPYPARMVDVLPTTHELVPEGRRFRVRRVPIFAETAKADTKGTVHTFDRAWLEAAAAVGNARQRTGYRAPVHLVHHHRVAAPPRVADLENYSVAEALFEEPYVAADGSVVVQRVVRTVLFADIVFDDGEAIDLANKHPHRSVEIADPTTPQVSSLALLGAEAPHHPFPNLRLDRAPALVFSASTAGKGCAATWSAPITFARQGMPSDEKQDEKDAAAKAPAAGEQQAEQAPAADEAGGSVEEKLDTLIALVQKMCAGGMAAAAMAPGVASPVVTPVAMEAAAPAPAAGPTAGPTTTPGTPAPLGVAVTKLEAELAVAKDKAILAERRLTVADAITALEAEGYAVGAQTRAHFERVAARGDSLEDSVAVVRTLAPKLPRQNEAALGARAVLLEAKDAPEVAAYGAPDDPMRVQARNLAVQFELINKHGGGALKGMPLRVFLEKNVGRVPAGKV